MKRYKTTLEIEITPEILADLFWEFDADEQAEFFNNLSKLNRIDFENQMEHMRESEQLTIPGLEYIRILVGL